MLINQKPQRFTIGDLRATVSINTPLILLQVVERLKREGRIPVDKRLFLHCYNSIKLIRKKKNPDGDPNGGPTLKLKVPVATL